MVRVKDLCQSCRSFDRCNWECDKEHYLDGDSDMFTIECEDYEEENVNEQ